MSDTTSDRILFRLKTSGPQSAADLASRFSVTTEAVRQLLVKLEGDGLVGAEDKRAGRGRPRRMWHLTNQGHARFPDRHSDLTVGLIEAVRAEFGDDGLDRLISRREREQAEQYHGAVAGSKSIKKKVSRLAEIRDSEGYMAEVRDLPEGGHLLVENHCPVCAAAAKCQSLCRSELSIFRDVLGDTVDVERTDHILAGARRCAYRITPR